MSIKPLYFIAIIPPEPIKESVTSIKKKFADNFNAKRALRSSPHITLIPPFSQKLNQEEELESFLNHFTENVNAFKLALDGFDCFKPRVVFLRPIQSQDLTILQSHLSASFYGRLGFEKPTQKPYHPHMTVAFRDLTKSSFYQAWSIYEKQEFKAQFIVDRLYLLKHNGSIWEEIQDFPFRGGTLPV